MKNSTTHNNTPNLINSILLNKKPALPKKLLKIMFLSKLTKAKLLRTINIEIMVIIETITTITPITKIRIKSMLQRALLLKKLSPKLKLKSSPQLSQFQSRWRLLKRKNQSHLNLKRRKCRLNKLSN